eukprot:6156608-Alexandrium_andersonii.AAC.1
MWRCPAYAALRAPGVRQPADPFAARLGWTLLAGGDREPLGPGGAERCEQMAAIHCEETKAWARRQRARG